MRIMPFMKRKKGVQFAGAGASDYDDLSNKPQIGGVTLTGNKTLADLGVQSVLTFDDTPTENSSNPVKSGGVWSELNSNIRNQVFEYDYEQPTVAGTTYEIDNAKSVVFGLPSTSTIRGISLVEVGGNNHLCANTTLLYRPEGDKAIFKPDSSNSVYVGFLGVVFYTM